MTPNTTETPHKSPDTEESEKNPGKEGALLPDLSAMVAQAKVTLSKTFPPGVDEIRFGRYVLRALPSAHDSSEAVLQFNNAPDEKGSSHPQAEAAFVCQLLSLFTEGRCKPTSEFRIGGVNVSRPQQLASPSEKLFFGVIDAAHLEQLLQRTLGLGDSLSLQFLRAAKAYSSAIEFIPSDPTFAFFLLTAAIECLSTQDEVIPFVELSASGKTCERFCRFVKTYLPEEVRGEDEKDEDLFVALLKEIYYRHRSAFTHGGNEVSGASLQADLVGSSYFKHFVDGKERRTPGLGWFAWVTRASLLGFLISRSTGVPDDGRLARIALDGVKLQMKTKKDLKAHTIVMSGDVEYR